MEQVFQPRDSVVKGHELAPGLYTKRCTFTATWLKTHASSETALASCKTVRVDIHSVPRGKHLHAGSMA